MRNFIKAAILAAVLILSVLLTACDSNNSTAPEGQFSKTSTAESEKETEPAQSPDELKEELIGQWGRLEEVMHYFTKDGRCVIGGIQGSYEIDGECNLILKTMDGSTTVYGWGQASYENYWGLEDEFLTVNGSQFTKIYGKETPDYVE